MSISEKKQRERRAVKQPGAVAFVIYQRHRFLLLLRDKKLGIPYPNTWIFPGGVIEVGEAPRDAAAREIAEEFSMQVSPGDLELMGEYIREKDTMPCFIFLYKGSRAPGVAQEGQQSEWFSWEEVQKTQLGFEQNRYIIPLIRRALRM